MNKYLSVAAVFLVFTGIFSWNADLWAQNHSEKSGSYLEEAKRKAAEEYLGSRRTCNSIGWIGWIGFTKW
ncbi:MAG: hypothetical protein WA705_24510 [Candidatus Ozemobacteraceae bacterium]